MLLNLLNCLKRDLYYSNIFNMQVFWKVYFWIITILALTGALMVYGNVGLLNLASIFELSVTGSLVLGLYCYAFNKNIFSATFWKFIFWYVIVIDTVYRVLFNYTIFKPYLEFNLPTIFKSQVPDVYMDFSTFILGMLILLPLFIAIYRISKGSSLK